MKGRAADRCLRGTIDTAYKLVADARESGDAPAGQTGSVTRARIGRYG
jgi:hypothetical protein